MITQTCPSDEDLAAFLDNRLTGDERKAVLEHLARCSECREVWTDISLFKEQSEHRIFYKTKTFISGMAFAIAACLILMLFPPSLKSLLQKSYDMTKKLHFSPEYSERIFTLPWESARSSYGFSGSKKDDPQYKAFGAGLWEGKKLLSQDSKPGDMPKSLSQDWQKGQWKIYYNMGQWIFLMRAACLSDSEIPVVFWKDQLRILEKLQKELASVPDKSEEDTRIASESLEIIRTVLKNASEKTLTRQQRGRIAAESERLTEHFSPKG